MALMGPKIALDRLERLLEGSTRRVGQRETPFTYRRAPHIDGGRIEVGDRYVFPVVCPAEQQLEAPYPVLRVDHHVDHRGTTVDLAGLDDAYPQLEELDIALGADRSRTPSCAGAHRRRCA